jgi:hypothetical protein
MEEEHAVRDELLRLALAEKTASENPAWSASQRAGKGWLRIVCPLAIDGIVKDGLRLEIHGPEDVRPEGLTDDMTANLIATRRGRDWHLGRIDFGKTAGHRNNHKAADLEPEIVGPHFHGAERNAKLGLSALSHIANLPIAVRLDRDPTSFREVLDEIADRFNIPGLWLEEPQWSIVFL